MALLGDAQLHIYEIEHERRERLSHRRHLAVAAQEAQRARVTPAAGRGLILRLASALGLP